VKLTIDQLKRFGIEEAHVSALLCALKRAQAKSGWRFAWIKVISTFDCVQTRPWS
jgi:hypothetical protein